MTDKAVLLQPDPDGEQTIIYMCRARVSRGRRGASLSRPQRVRRTRRSTTHRGYDNRNTTTPAGTGTVQLVTPVLTRWYQPAANYETAGIGILRIKFVPEPQTWAMLVAGISLLGVVYGMRGR